MRWTIILLRTLISIVRLILINPERNTDNNYSFLSERFSIIFEKKFLPRTKTKLGEFLSHFFLPFRKISASSNLLMQRVSRWKQPSAKQIAAGRLFALTSKSETFCTRTIRERFIEKRIYIRDIHQITFFLPMGKRNNNEFRFVQWIVRREEMASDGSS